MKKLLALFISIGALMVAILTGNVEAPIGARTGTADVQIGTNVQNGTSGSVLFVSSVSQVSQDNTNFNFNDTTDLLTIGGKGIFGASTASSSGTDFELITTGTTTFGFESGNGVGTCLEVRTQSGVVAYARFTTSGIVVNTISCK